VALVLVCIGGIKRPYIGSDFSYSADLAITTNLYDAANQRYSGVRYSTGTLYYQLQGVNRGVATIRSGLIAKDTVSGTKINVAQTGEAVAQTGAYVPTANDQVAHEYIFAPRNLQPRESFAYRDVAYNKPATMKYAGQETIYGLSVFHYVAIFPEDIQSVSSAAQATLPDGTKLVYRPKLEMWVEPFSGWLVKLDDNGSISRQDAQTGGQVGPYSQYTAQFTDDSILQQVNYAKSLKNWQMVVQRVLPGAIITILFLIGIGFALWHLRAVVLSVRVLVGVACAVCSLALVGWAVHSRVFAQLFFGDAGLHPLAALCFVATALSILLIQRQQLRAVRFLLGLSVVTAGLWALIIHAHASFLTVTLVPHGSAVNAITQGNSLQISPYAACTFILLGLALCKAAYSDRRTMLALRFVGFLAAVVVSLGLTVLLLQVLQLDSIFALSLAYPLSGISAILFVLSGYLLLVVTNYLQGVPMRGRHLLRQWLKPTLFSIPLLIIGSVAQVKQNEVQSQLQGQFVTAATRVQEELKSTLRSYSQLLTGTQALFASSHDVTADEWHTFIGAYSIQKNFPGVQNIGYATVLQPSQVAGFVRTQQQITSNYMLYPANQRATLTPVTYIEPHTPVQQKLLGYDMFTDDAHGAAMDAARDENVASITNEIQITDAKGRQRPGFVLFLPVYQTASQLRPKLNAAPQPTGMFL